MADRVLSTAEARRAIQNLQRIINGDLIDTITALNREGQVLSQREVWDGNLAMQFRDLWPDIKAKLDETKTKLEELRGKVQDINKNIMTAGGNE